MANTPELLINNADVYRLYGVRMGEGFIDTLTEPLALKDNIENESRLENGKRIIFGTPLFQSREIILDFTIGASTPEQLWARRSSFTTLLCSGVIRLQVPKVSNETYRLIYRGKGSEYSMNRQRTFCHLMLKFVEANPADRGLD